MDFLNKKYGEDFGATNNEYNWIPTWIINNRNFLELEKHVELSHFHPFYNSSCDSVHGGAKGFYRMGLMSEFQDDVLLVGASNYGLADPLQNTSISLNLINVAFLTYNPDFESLIHMHIMESYIQDIGSEALRIQQHIENEERNN